MRSKLINITMVLFSIALTLIATDIALRLFSSVAPRSGQFIPEPSNYQRLNPRTVTLSPGYQGLLNGRDFSDIPININHFGFRDKAWDIETLARSEPILFLGDSYLWGWGVPGEQRASDLVSTELSARGIDTPVLNMTIPGSGSYQALDLFREFGLPLNPRLVVLGFFVGNDFLDNLAVANVDPGRSAEGSKTPASLTLIDAAEQARSVSLRELLRSSPVFNLVKYGLWEFSAFRRLFNHLEIKNDRIALYAELPAEAQSKLYGPTLEALGEIANLSRSADIPLLVLIIPDHLQVLEPQLFSDYDSHRPQRILSQHLAELQLPHVDLLPEFNGVSDPRQLFFREDKHWSRAGNALVSRIIIAATLPLLAGDTSAALPLPLPSISRYPSVTDRERAL